MPSASHSYTSLAIRVFLQTMMNTGGLPSPRRLSHSRHISSQSPASIVMGVFAHLRTASGFTDPRRPPRSAGVKRSMIHRQMFR